MLQKILILSTLVVAGFSLSVAGCERQIFTHRLVATSTDQSVPLYPDEQTYLKVSRERQEGGVSGMTGDVRQSIEAKKIDNDTRVTIVSSDENGATVQITDGPMKGQTGFVAKTNID